MGRGTKPLPDEVVEPIVVLSPHLDDAVLSCGVLLAANGGARVVTVFAGMPTDRET
jgi:LmbE family N-acetylglucosaminyl deacetylase